MSEPGTDAADRVLVVGAGPTGLLLAIELERRGIDVLLIDALDQPQAWDRATVVHARSIEIFEALGLADRFTELGVHTRAARFHSGGRVLGKLDLTLAESRYRYYLGMSEETTERLLAEYLEQLGGAVTRGTRLVDLGQGNDGVDAVLERNGERHEVKVGWVVGCDGLHSVVRELAGIEFEGTDIEAPWAVFDATASGWPHEYDVEAAFLEQPPVVLTPLPGQRWRIYMRPSSDEVDLVEEASEILHRYEPDVELVDIANPTRFHCHSRVAARYRAGRLLLAGDAAHACTPGQGHGMNTGLQDAFNLGWKLALVCHGLAAEELLDTYEIERRPIALSVVASGADAEASLTLTDAAARAERDAGMQTVFGDSGEQARHEAAAAAEVDRSYAGSPIISGNTEAPIPAGRRLPELALESDGRPLHELATGTGHALVVVGGPLANTDRVAALAAELRAAHGDSPAVDAVLDHVADADASQRLGIDAIAILAIRPDRYVGLRADDDDPTAVSEYLQTLLGAT